MPADRRTLNLAAAVLCGIGSLATILSAALSRGPRDGATRSAMMSGLFGLVGSAAWAASAYQDIVESQDELELA